MFVNIFPCHFLLKICQNAHVCPFLYDSMKCFLSFLCCARIFRNKNLRCWKNFFKSFLSVCLVDICSTRIGVYFFWKMNKLAFSRIRKIMTVAVKRMFPVCLKDRNKFVKMEWFYFFLLFSPQIEIVFIDKQVLVKKVFLQTLL